MKLRVSTSDQQESGHASPEQDEGAMNLPDQDHDAIEDEWLAPVVDIPSFQLKL